jgi:hypothetical protein
MKGLRGMISRDIARPLIVMNRPVVGTLSILALLGGGLYFAWSYKDKPVFEPGQNSYEGAAARSAIQAWLELPLPASASDVHTSMEEIGRTKVVYARFDVPPVELPALFDQGSRFPEAAKLVADASLVQAMGSLGDPMRPWWQVDQLTDATAAQKSGKRNVAPAALKWRVQVCAGTAAGGMTRVYIAFSEEPVEEK